MGVRLAKLSPTRGFAAELSTALVIMVASQFGLPTSSSQVGTHPLARCQAQDGGRAGPQVLR